MRSAIVGELMTAAGIDSGKEDLHRELKPSRITRDSSDLQKLISGIEETHNPFTQHIPLHLYNIHNGKAASDDVKEHLLSFNKWGEMV